MKKIILTLLFFCIGSFTLFGTTEEPDIFSTFLLKTGHTGYINYVSRQNEILVSSSSDQTIKLWNLNTGELIDSFLFTQNITSAVLSHDEDTLFVTDSSEMVFKVDVSSGRIVQESDDHFASHLVGCQSFLWEENLILINNKIVLALDQDTLERSWSVEIAQLFPQSWGEEFNITRSGEQLLCTDGMSVGLINLSDGTVDAVTLSMERVGYSTSLWPLDTSRVLGNEYTDVFCYSAADNSRTRFSDMRGEIYFTGQKGFALKNESIHVFNLELEEVNTLSPGFEINSGTEVFFPDDTSLAVTSSEGDLYYYSDRSGKEALVLGEVKVTPANLVVQARRKGQFVTARLGGKSVRSWQTSNGNLRRTYESDEPVRFLSVNAAQDTLFVGTDHSLRYLNLSTLSERGRRDIEGKVEGMAYSECLDALVIYEYTYSEQSLKIWHWKDKDSTLETVPVADGNRNDFLISLDDVHLLLTDGNDYYECYNMADKTRVWEIKESLSNRRDIFYGLEDGKFFLIKTDGKIFRETTPGVLAESARLGNYGAGNFLAAADLSMEASVLAAGTSDGTLLYFDWTTLEMIHSIDTGNYFISSMFITDEKYGRQLLFTNDTGALCLWTRINDRLKYLAYPLGESAMVIKPSRDTLSPNYFGEISEEDHLFEARRRIVPEVIESSWEALSQNGSPRLKISSRTENIPDGTILNITINQCNPQGHIVNTAARGLTCLVENGKAELIWEPVDVRDANEISDLWFSYFIDSCYSDRFEGDPIQVIFPEIQESFWYCDRAAPGEPAILSLVVRDLDPNEKITLELFESEDRRSVSAILDGLRIGDMEHPIMINNQRFSHAGLKKGTLYYVTLHTENGLEYTVPEPVSYQ